MSKKTLNYWSTRPQAGAGFFAAQRWKRSYAILMVANEGLIFIDGLLIVTAHSWVGLDVLVGIGLYIAIFVIQVIAVVLGLVVVFDRRAIGGRGNAWPLGVVSVVGLVTGGLSLMEIFLPR